MAITFGESGSYYSGPSSYNKTFSSAPNLGLGVNIPNYNMPSFNPLTNYGVSQTNAAALAQAQAAAQAYEDYYRKQLAAAQQAAAQQAAAQQAAQQQRAGQNPADQYGDRYDQQNAGSQPGGPQNPADKYGDRYDQQNAPYTPTKPNTPNRSGWLWDMFGMLGAGSLAQSQAWMGNTYGESPWNPLIKQDTLTMLNQKYKSAGAGFNKDTAYGGKPEYLQALRDQHTENYINFLLKQNKGNNGNNGGNGYPYPPWQFPQINFPSYGGGSYSEALQRMYNALMNWQVKES